MLVLAAFRFISTSQLIPRAAQGIGRGIALRLAADGFTVAVNDVSSNSANLDTLVAEITRFGRKSSAHVADVSEAEQVEAMVAAVVAEHGGLDVVRFSFFVRLGDWEYVSDQRGMYVFA